MHCLHCVNITYIKQMDCIMRLTLKNKPHIKKKQTKKDTLYMLRLNRKVNEVAISRCTSNIKTRKHAKITCYEMYSSSHLRIQTFSCMFAHYDSWLILLIWGDFAGGVRQPGFKPRTSPQIMLCPLSKGNLLRQFKATAQKTNNVLSLSCQWDSWILSWK